MPHAIFSSSKILSNNALLLVIAGIFLAPCEAGTLRYDRETALNFEFAGKRMPQWSGGVLSGLESNHTAMPQIVTFEGQSKPAGLLPILVPGSDLIDVADWTRGAGEVVVACGAAYYKAGRNAGFLAIHVSDSAPLRVVRLEPYYPFHVIVAEDGTIWTTGLEMVDGHENRAGVSADRGVIRRFDVSGKLLATYIPRRSLPSGLMLTYSHLASGPDRIGWYTGPSHGPTSRYYEITLSGETRVFASPPLSETSHVSGIAIGSDRRAYASISNPDIHRALLYSIAPGKSAWKLFPVNSPRPATSACMEPMATSSSLSSSTRPISALSASPHDLLGICSYRGLVLFVRRVPAKAVVSS